MNEFQKNEFKKLSDSSFEFLLEGKRVSFEIDTVAKKSDKSIVCRYGKTTILTVLTVKKLNKISSFFPLNITFEEKFYSIGKIPGSFGKREGKPSYESIITSRLIDRFLRPLFPLSSQTEVHINNCILSVDPNCDPRVAACLNSSLICYLSSSVPFFNTPVSTSLIDDKNFPLDANSEVFLSSLGDKIVMIDAKTNELAERKFETIIKGMIEKNKRIGDFFLFVGKNFKKKQTDGESGTSYLNRTKYKVDADFRAKMFLRLKEVIGKSINWIEKEKEMKEIRQNFTEVYLYEKNPEREDNIESFVECIWDDCIKEIMIEKWDSEKIRLDGRRSNEIREIKLMKDYLPNVHGSSIFSRGGTEVLSVSTLGKLSEKLSSDSLLSKHHKTFIHHYNFPQFAVNEVTSYRGISRREVGHGELVEKAFSFIVPKTEKFPHTIRVVSEVLSSDGSSSQASICSTSLSLMSSGVPLERHVAGISIGLFRGEIYTDINGIEDKLGEMDFKIAGTDRGICSVQLDVKNRGISLETFRNSIEKAKESRLEIIGIMNREIPYHRKKLAPEVTKCFSFKIEKALIGLVVGPKGRNINRIMEDNDSFIEIQNDGNVLIYNKNQEKLDKTYQDIRRIIRENS